MCGVSLCLARRHGLVSVLGGFLVLRVRHREEVLQLPLQRLERRPLHRVLGSRKVLIFYYNWKYFNLLPRSSWFYNQQFTWSFWSLRRNYLSLEPLNVKLANYQTPPHCFSKHKYKSWPSWKPISWIVDACSPCASTRAWCRIGWAGSPAAAACGTHAPPGAAPANKKIFLFNIVDIFLCDRKYFCGTGISIGRRAFFWKMVLNI